MLKLYRCDKPTTLQRDISATRWVYTSVEIWMALAWRKVGNFNRPGVSRRLESLTVPDRPHLAVPTPHLIHYGSWKACTLRNRCSPSIYRSSWCQAFYRFRVRILLPNSITLSATDEPLFSFSLDSIRSPSPTLLSDHGLNDILALAKQCSIPYKER